MPVAAYASYTVTCIRRPLGDGPARRFPLEREVGAHWQSVAAAGDWFETAEGDRWRVVYPGRPAAGGGGPDWQDVVIEDPEGRRRQGDVEVHVQARDWWSHGHHRDPAYEDTLFQVCLVPASRRGEGGMPPDAPPTVVLPVQPDAPAPAATTDGALPCGSAWPRRPASVERELVHAGVARFLHKACRLRSSIEQVGPEAALYRGLLETLGYGGNEVPFRRLAEALPRRELRILVARSPAHLRETLQAILLGSAGFLVEGDAGQWGGKLRPLRDLWRVLDASSMLMASDWRRAGLRPGNRPVPRLLAAAALLDRWWDAGLWQTIMAAVATASPAQLRSSLLGWLGVGPHPDAPGKRMSLIGPGRVDEMAANVVLPLAHAAALEAGNRGLARRALALYRSWPGLSGSALLRHMSGQLGIPASWRGSACRQQGLLHLYRDFCRAGRCPECPLARRLASISSNTTSP